MEDPNLDKPLTSSRFEGDGHIGVTVRQALEYIRDFANSALEGEHGEYFVTYLPASPDDEYELIPGVWSTRTDNADEIRLPVPTTWEGIVADLLQWVADRAD